MPIAMRLLASSLEIVLGSQQQSFGNPCRPFTASVGSATPIFGKRRNRCYARKRPKSRWLINRKNQLAKSDSTKPCGSECGDWFVKPCRSRRNWVTILMQFGTLCIITMPLFALDRYYSPLPKIISKYTELLSHLAQTLPIYYWCADC